jgi:hypothetical protein
MRALLNDGTLSATAPLNDATLGVTVTCGSAANPRAILNAPDSSNNGHTGVNMVRREGARWTGRGHR